MNRIEYTPTDRFEELDRIDLDGVFDVLDIYCRNLLPDLEACLVFLNRILRDQTAAGHPRTRDEVSRLVRKAVSFGPFHLQALGLAHKLTGDPALDARLERLGYFDLDPKLQDLRSVMNDPGIMERKRSRLMDVMERMPGHILAANQLLQLDFYQGIEHGDWLDSFTVPKFFQAEWEHRLFVHLAGLGNTDDALMLWRSIANGPISEIQLNLAAECFIRSGDTGQALALYGRSLEIDPAQHPVRLRMAELENPFIPDPALIPDSSVAICLYSWNKADDLERTLTSLARTDIGPATIRVLLNGCTDRSEAVCEAARSLFPDNDFDTVILPVNVGAPAARNWLGALPEVRNKDFVAYLDDDVELQSDWLAHFLTVMECQPRTAVVGCKVVFGTEPRMIQYLHRTFSLAEPGMIKLTDACQIGQMDCGHYDFIRTTDTVMGCCHLLRMAHMPDGPQFDIRYSPSQVDDIAHDLTLRVNGFDVHYTGLVRCIHHQNTGGGFKRRMTQAQLGQVLGNDMKFYYSFSQHMERLREIIRQAAI